MSDRPLILNVYQFLKTQPLFCVKCENFTHTATEFCEHCGSRYSLRKAKIKDVKNYNKSKPKTPTKPVLDVSQQYAPLRFSLERDIRLFLSNYRFFCEYCKRFSVRNQGYCENCGTQRSLRRSSKSDIEKYNKMCKQYIQNQLKAKIKPSKSMPDVSHLRHKELKPIPETTEKREGITEEIPKICPNCGYKILNLKNRFCVNCGFQLKRTLPEITQEEKIKPITAEEEKPEVDTTPQEQEISLISKVEQPKSYEKPVVKVPQVKTEELKPIPIIPEKKEEIPKPTHKICRFCGLKLELTEKFCYQCGTIMK